MKSLFTQTLEAFILAFILFMLIVTSVFIAGMDKSLISWDNEKNRELNEAFRSLLEERVLTEDDLLYVTRYPELNTLIPESTSLLIFDREKNLLSAYRGNVEGDEWGSFYLRNHAPEIVYHEIRIRGKHLGYFYIGLPAFSTNPANKKLLKSIEGALWSGIGGAFLLSFSVAYFFSRKHSEAAELVARGINRIARGEFELVVPAKGAREIIRIARNANRLGQELKREAELRSQWSQDITHDLRTPLGALRAQLEGMKDGVLDMTPRRMEMNLKELERIEKLVEDLGTLTRLESPEARLQVKEIKTADLVEALENRFAGEWEARGIRWDCREEVRSFPGDEYLLLRGISNLMDNALRHTPPGGTIRFSVNYKGDDVELRIYNEGPAIPPGEVEKVFDRLFRGEFARSSPGSGLGLTITRQIVELHRGRVGIESNGAGTVVWMVLPGKRGGSD